MTTAEVTVYTDGACSGNPGPGGWAAMITEGGVERAVSGAEPHTTNQPMELPRGHRGVAAIPGRRRVQLFTDSAYVMNCFRDRWYRSGRRTAGWRRQKPVTNRDMWERLIAETRRHEVVWNKVRGHSGDV